MGQGTPLDSVRVKIDTIDLKLLTLLKERSDLVGRVTEIKKQYGMPAYQPERFESMMRVLQEKATSLGVDPGLVDAIWNAIHDSSKNQQNKTLL